MAMFKKTVLLVCMVCLLAAVAMFAAGCQEKDPTTVPPTTAKPIVSSAQYTITVRTAGGALLKDVTVYVRKSATDRDLVDLPNKLNSEGKYTFVAPQSSDYVVELEGVPAGYDVQPQYTLTGTEMEIVLNSAPIQGEVPAGTIYKPGDIIHDYAFTDINGVQYKISDILKEKNALVLNFWYVNCSFCIKEFPTLQEAYALHNENVEVLALDIEDDTEFEINKVVEELGLTFPIIKVDPSLLSAMRSGSCPTTVVIDRYGMVSFIYAGDLSTEPAAFRALMRHFGAEDYQQGVVEATEEAIDKLITVEDIPYGCEKYPYAIGGVEQFVGEVRADKPVYYTMYRSAKLRIEDPDVYMTIDGVDYYPVNGVLEYSVTVTETFNGVPMQLHTTGGVDKEVIIYLSPNQGGTENPTNLHLGELTFSVNNQDTFYSFTAQQTGVFTITVSNLPAGVTCRINMTNLRTMEVSESSSEDQLDQETGVASFTIAVEAGDSVRIIVSVYSEDPTHTEIQALASIQEGGGVGPSENAYSVTVRDESGMPVAGVELKVVLGDQILSTLTDENGVASIDVQPGTYRVTMVLPEGYFAATEYLLTPGNRELEVVLVPMRQYTVQVSLIGGELTAPVTVKIYTSAALQELVCSGKLDENGCFTFGYGYIDSCVAVLEGLPGNVFVQSSYPLSGDLTEIQLVSTSIGDTNAANQHYELGQKIHDFSVTTPDGRVFSVYELLEQKQVVVLNFWHIGSASALQGMQALEDVYQSYSNTVELLAMNPLDKSDGEIAAFQGRNDFSFPMAQCSGEWESAFHLTAYPTMVVLDRDGTVCLIHSGAITDTTVLDVVLAHYTAADYETTVVSSITQLLPGQPDGSPENPYIVEQGTAELSVNLAAGQSVCYLFQELELLQLRVEDAHVYITYNGEIYEADNGVLELVINTTGDGTQQTVTISNGGPEAVTLHITLSLVAAG